MVLVVYVYGIVRISRICTIIVCVTTCRLVVLAGAPLGINQPIVSHDIGRRQTSSAARSVTTPPPVPKRQPKTSVSHLGSAAGACVDTPPLPIPPRAAPRRQLSQPPPPAPPPTSSVLGDNLPPYRLRNDATTDNSDTLSVHSLDALSQRISDSSVYASVEDIRKGVTSLMNRLKDENLVNSGGAMQSSFKSDVTSQRLPGNVGTSDDGAYGTQFRLNERGFLEQMHVSKKRSPKPSEHSQPISIQTSAAHRGNTTSRVHSPRIDVIPPYAQRSASVDVTEHGFSRSVPNYSPASSSAYARAMSTSNGALSPTPTSGQNTCDSGIGSEMNGSSERLARGVSKCSLHSDTSLDVISAAAAAACVDGDDRFQQPFEGKRFARM